MTNPTIIGIDLGTTNSLCSIWQDEQAILIPNVLGHTLTPSVVGLDNERQIIVGEMAKQRLTTHPKYTIASFKRYMGTDRSFKIGWKLFRPEELSALILKNLKADAEAHLNTTITEAVISVPAYFSDAQRKATKIAGELAGLTVRRLINEPTAAAIAYGLHEADNESTFLVFDLGGGTFDVSILELFDGVMQVHASAGNNHLGGEDFVDVIIQYVLAENKLKHQDLNLKQRAVLRQCAEQAKHQLTQHQQTTIDPNHKKIQTTPITRKIFETISDPLLEAIKQPLRRVMTDASLNVNDLDTVVLVGGASKMPLIRSMVSKMFRHIPNSHINPDEVVAIGTAVQVGLITRGESLKEIVLTDVAPYTLGTGVLNKNSNDNSPLFAPIIERNSPIPISRSKIFVTASDNQTIVQSNIYQGESRLVKDNIKLGEISIDVPPKPANEESIETRFTYDVNGLLEVDITVLSTGLKKSMVIESSENNMSKEDIKHCLEKLAELKIHPRDQVENATLIARGERLYEESIGEKRDYIGGILEDFNELINQQDVNAIEMARLKIVGVFDEVELDKPFC
ncbi:MAG: molecular chaperone HscC [Methylococcales bacterium]|jgi:molecular chaperone HscC|nr:molecular chaperone HscC [Methylococcales bacterium]MBT7408966.1 molecular chaperone HscC [Methylococcales bacterium]